MVTLAPRVRLLSFGVLSGLGAGGKAVGGDNIPPARAISASQSDVSR